MMFTLTLDDVLTAQLQQQAAACKVPPEAFAVQLLREILAHQADTVAWQQQNQRRITLIHKSLTTTLSQEEARELEGLQAALDQRLSAMDEPLLAALTDMQQAVAALPDDPMR